MRGRYIRWIAGAVACLGAGAGLVLYQAARGVPSNIVGVRLLGLTALLLVAGVSLLGRVVIVWVRERSTKTGS